MLLLVIERTCRAGTPHLAVVRFPGAAQIMYPGSAALNIFRQ
jgi:hypothetical protein